MSKDMSISVLLDFYGNLLGDKKREVIEYYYNDDLSLAEISELVGISRQGVRDSIKRSEELITDMETKLGLARRFSETDALLSRIKEIAAEINVLNNGVISGIPVKTADITEICDRISEQDL